MLEHYLNDWHLLVNELMEQLRRKGIGADQLTRTFLDLIASESTSLTVRDYAVQHLGHGINPREDYSGRRRCGR